MALTLILLVSIMFFPVRAHGAEPTKPWIIVDDLGHRVEMPEEANRIVSLVPTNSEMVCLLDCERLVGGTRYDRFPNELSTRMRTGQLEIVGGGFDASVEKIVRLAPDLILANGPSQQKIVAPLKRMGYSVWSIWPRDLENLKKDFLMLGHVVGQQARARDILDGIEHGFLEIRRKAKGKRSKRVYLQMWSDPMITVGKNSFPHWLLSTIGGINIFGDMAFDSGQVSLEWIVKRDPEVLIFLNGQEVFAKRIAKLPVWQSIGAVQHAHFCFIDSADIRRSVQFVEGLAKLHDCLFRVGTIR